MGSVSSDPTHFLYTFKYSICSIMVRYTYAVRGTSNDPQNEIRMEEKEVDLMKGEQLAEHYMCEINPAGKVPVLAAVDSDITMPDSLEITKYFGRSYPSLFPEPHTGKIIDLLQEIHRINYFSLTFTGKPEAAQGWKAELQKKLEGNISEKYRKAIEYKIGLYDKLYLDGLKDEVVKENEERTRKLMLKFQEMLLESQTDWLLGLSEPSALDAHLVVLIARLYDVNRHNLIPEKVQQYGNQAMATKAWLEVMQGRNTSPL